mgnify:CR=1 FL=1
MFTCKEEKYSQETTNLKKSLFMLIKMDLIKKLFRESVAIVQATVELQFLSIVDRIRENDLYHFILRVS